MIFPGNLPDVIPYVIESYTHDVLRMCQSPENMGIITESYIHFDYERQNEQKKESWFGEVSEKRRGNKMILNKDLTKSQKIIIMISGTV